MAVTYGGPDTDEYYYRPHQARGECASCSKKNNCTHINYHTVDCNDEDGYYANWGSTSIG